MRPLSALITIFLLPLIGHGATIHVPKDYPTIQQAIDGSNNNDVVIVAQGTYVENIDFKGKAITVKSDTGPDLTVIDGNQTGAVVKFVTKEGVNSVLQGFTLTNGTGEKDLMYFSGGGVYCNNASCIIRDNIIHHNIVTGDGGGIYATTNGAPLIENNRILYNIAWGGRGGGVYCTGKTQVINNNISFNETVWIGASYGYGGGIYSSGSSLIEGNTISDNLANDYGGGLCLMFKATVRNNIIKNNTAGDFGGGVYFYAFTSILQNNIIFNNEAGMVWCGDGGGVSCENTAAPIIEANTITQNSGYMGHGGIYCGKKTSPIIRNTIIWGNMGSQLSGVATKVTYSNIQGGWPGLGNINADPLFVDPTENDFHITYTSPCKDAGDNASATHPTDFEGDDRIADGVTDIGADEFFIHLYGAGDHTPGGKAQLKFIEAPNTSPVILWLGSGVLSSPVSLPPHGLWFLEFPILAEDNLGAIPGPNGVLLHQGRIPVNFPTSLDLPFQAAVGNLITNLYVMKIR